MARPGKGKPADEARVWLADLDARGAVIYIPEVADYEVRRELLRAGATAGIRRLDALKSDPRLRYLPITTEAMLRAAEMWAAVRHAGAPTAGRESLDGDAVLAGQALTVGAPGDAVTIATENLGHLSRFPGVNAELWTKIV